MTLLNSPTLLYAVTLPLLFQVAVTDPPPYFRSNQYEHGSLGIYPELSFKSTNLKAPQLNRIQWSSECQSSHEYYFIAPRGLFAQHVGPVILNTDGHMIWHREDFGITYNFNVQQYMGKDVLTFWSGDDMVTGHGSGHYYIFDETYTLLHKVSALNNLSADLHEFRITSSNTALLTAYVPLKYDLTDYNISSPGQETYIFDCVFQEIDIASSTLLFEWRASHHFRLEDCFNVPVGPLAGTFADPFDYFHLNSIDKDLAGDYIISARYSHSVTKISGRTGDIVWHLGGRNNSFVDASIPRSDNNTTSWTSSFRIAESRLGPATDFIWQHHALWQYDYTHISLFDNGAFFGETVRPARGLLVAVDEDRMTATLVREWTHPDALIAESQGSLQLLENGNAFVGYGAAAAFTEFDRETGDVRCDVHFAALYHDRGAFSPGAVTSYRTYKRRWVGYPSEEPCVKFADGRLFVSWNGATQVREWLLERKSSRSAGLVGDDVLSRQQFSKDWSQAKDEDQGWEEVGRTAWTGFESNMTVVEDYVLMDGPHQSAGNLHATYRLTALGFFHDIPWTNGVWWRSVEVEHLQSVLGVWELQADNAVRRVSAPTVPFGGGVTPPKRTWAELPTMSLAGVLLILALVTSVLVKKKDLYHPRASIIRMF